jgi:hypothetical protein
MSKPPLEVGMRLWFQGSPRSGNASREVTVLSVGRKWAQLDNRNRINLDNWVADGGVYSSPGRCYESKEDYDAEVQLQGEWDAFRRSIERCYRVPDGMTIERIAEMTRLLKQE